MSNTEEIKELLKIIQDSQLKIQELEPGFKGLFFEYGMTRTLVEIWLKIEEDNV